MSILELYVLCEVYQIEECFWYGFQTIELSEVVTTIYLKNKCMRLKDIWFELLFTNQHSKIIDIPTFDREREAPPTAKINASEIFFYKRIQRPKKKGSK